MVSTDVFSFTHNSLAMWRGFWLPGKILAEVNECRGAILQNGQK